MQTSKNKKIYFYAPNVWTGGGKVLILSIINLIIDSKNNKNFYMILDKRIKYELNSNYNIETFFCEKNIFSRLFCEYKFSKKANKNDIILIFNNVSLIFSTEAKCMMYLQHILFTGKYSPNKYSNKLKTKIVYSLYYLINKFFSKKIKKYYVQTQSMKNEIIKNNSNKSVSIFPFLSDEICENLFEKNNIYNFIYPANNYFHKNHKNLLNAFKILSFEKIYPSLLLTVGPLDLELINLINIYKEDFNLKIEILKEVKPNQISKYYNMSECLIFPSKFESFGMPLIEATKFNLKIVASELDYVRDVCEPDHTFDPNSPISIARAIKRFLGISNNEFKIKKPIDFINQLIE